MLRAQQGAEDFGQRGLSGGDVVTAEAGELAAKLAEVVANLVVGAEGRIERGEGREEQFNVVDLQGLVFFEGKLALPRDAGLAESGIEADAEQIDAFGILDEVAAGGGGGEEGDGAGAVDGGLSLGGLEGGNLHRGECGGIRLRENDQLENAGGLSGGGGGRQARADKYGSQGAGQIGVDGYGGGAGADQRRAAVILRVVEAEIGVVEGGGRVAGRDAVLIEVTAFAVEVARDAAQRAVVGEAAKAKEYVLAAAAGEIVGREIGAGGLDLVAAELQQPKRLDGEILRQADGGLEHVDREERFFEFGAGNT